MMSNKGLNSNEALDESTATNSSVTLSGIRRVKEAVIALDIKDYTPDPAFNHESTQSDTNQRWISPFRTGVYLCPLVVATISVARGAICRVREMPRRATRRENRSEPEPRAGSNLVEAMRAFRTNAQSSRDNRRL